MVVATKIIDVDKIIKLEDNPNEIYAYIRSLVPEELSHVESIYNNTRFYVNTLILHREDIPMEKKQKLSTILSTNISVVGYMGTYIDCSDLRRYVNMKQVNKYHKGDRK